MNFFLYVNFYVQPWDLGLSPKVLRLGSLKFWCSTAGRRGRIFFSFLFCSIQALWPIISPHAYSLLNKSTNWRISLPWKHPLNTCRNHTSLVLQSPYSWECAQDHQRMPEASHTASLIHAVFFLCLTEGRFTRDRARWYEVSLGTSYYNA